MHCFGRFKTRRGSWRPAPGTASWPIPRYLVLSFGVATLFPPHQWPVFAPRPRCLRSQTARRCLPRRNFAIRARSEAFALPRAATLRFALPPKRRSARDLQVPASKWGDRRLPAEPLLAAWALGSELRFCFGVHQIRESAARVSSRGRQHPWGQHGGCAHRVSRVLLTVRSEQ